MKIYIVIGGEGEYSSYWEWIIAAYVNEEDAKAHQDKALTLINQAEESTVEWTTARKEILKKVYDENEKLFGECMPDEITLQETELMGKGETL